MLSRRGAPYVESMVAVADQDAEPITADMATPPTIRRIGLVPSASMIVGAAIATVWLCLAIMIVIVSRMIVGFARFNGLEGGFSVGRIGCVFDCLCGTQNCAFQDACASMPASIKLERKASLNRSAFRKTMTAGKGRST